MKYYLTAIIVTIFFLSLPASAQDNVGLSYLGICHPQWPCQTSIDAYSKRSKLTLSFLYDRTFGDDCQCIRQIYKDARDKVTRIHLTNGPGLRNGRLQKEEVFFGYTISSADAAILQNDKSLKTKYEAIASRAASDYRQSIGINNLYISTCLECNFSKEAREKLIEWTKPFFHNATYVDNPLWGECIPGLICEKHGPTANLNEPCIADLDGKDFQDIDIPKFISKYKSCLATYLWGFKMNLIDNKQQNFVPPRKRTEIPDQKYFQSLIKSWESNS